MNAVIESLLTRRSVRKYEDKQLPDDVLDTILNVGLYAPSGMNNQETVMVAVRDKETRDLLSQLNAKVMMMGRDSDPFYGAPCVVVVFAKKAPNDMKDGSLVMANLMEAAHALGLGSCWINRADKMFEYPEGKTLLEKWGLSDEWVGVGNCILGYPLDEPAPAPRKDGRIIKA